MAMEFLNCVANRMFNIGLKKMETVNLSSCQMLWKHYPTQMHNLYRQYKRRINVANKQKTNENGNQ